MTAPSPDRYAELAHEHFGITGSATPLPGYVDYNAHLTTSDGAYLVRLAPTVDPTRLAFLIEAISAVDAAGIDAPTIVPTREGAPFATLADGATLRLHRWIPGTTFEELGQPHAVAASIGRTAAALVKALADLDAPPSTDTMWDLVHAKSTIAEHRSSLTSDAERRTVDSVLAMLHAVDLTGLPQQVVHNDLNPGNLIVSGDEVVGVIDFGDCTRTYRIAELAIACAYLMLDQDDPVAAASIACRTYAEQVEVTAAEARAILTLILVRLATSVAVAASQPSSNPHHHVTRDSTWDLLETLLAADLNQIDHELATALGHAPNSPLQPSLNESRSVLGGALSLSYAKPLTMVRGRGQYLFDHRARRYLDCVNNVCHVGHSEPRVVEALASQAATLNTNTRYLHPEVLKYADRLRSTMPEALDTVYVVNSGSEANELAIRIARTFADRSQLACVEHGYHGNTSTLIDVSHYKFAGPGGSGKPDDTFVLPSLDATADAIAYMDQAREALVGSEPAALIIEALSGCGGQLVPAEGVLESAYAAAHEAGALVIADEVQTGFGRVGDAFWAFGLFDVVPDIVTLGKPAGNGHPLGVVVTTRAISEAFDNGMEYFNTFGGNPVSAAVGNAVLDVIEQDGLQAHAKKVGAALMADLRAVADTSNRIGDVRGAGLFLGIEIVDDAGLPDAALATAIVEHAKSTGVLLSTDGPQHNVIKIKPPLVFTRDDAQRVAALVAEAL